MKTFVAFFLLLALMLLSISAYSQDYSGNYRKTADTRLDGVWENRFPSTFRLYQVSPGHYRSKPSTEGDVFEITIYQSGNKTTFTAQVFRIGTSYFSVSSGHVEGNTFKGTFADVNGALGNIQYVKQ